MAKFTLAGVTVDRCAACGGLWLDASELRLVARDDELEELVARADAGGETSPFACPRCGRACHAASVFGVALDRCASCHGIWVDADELREVRLRVDGARAERSRRGLHGLLAQA